MCERLAQQIVRVAGLGDDIETGLDQDVADSLAQEDVVLADHDPNRHGLTLLPLVGAGEQRPQQAARELVLGDESSRSD